MEATLPSDLIPVIDTDPFERETLVSPWQFHAQLRDAGEVAYLSRHGVYAMGRYLQVHEALTDWQHFRSAAGVGIVDYSKQKAWREPSPLIEADPPYHDASRRVLTELIGPRTLKALRQDWFSDADKLVDDIAGRRAIDARPLAGPGDDLVQPCRAERLPAARPLQHHNTGLVLDMPGRSDSR